MHTKIILTSMTNSDKKKSSKNSEIVFNRINESVKKILNIIKKNFESELFKEQVKEDLSLAILDNSKKDRIIDSVKNSLEEIDVEKPLLLHVINVLNDSLSKKTNKYFIYKIPEKKDSFLRKLARNEDMSLTEFLKMEIDDLIEIYERDFPNHR